MSETKNILAQAQKGFESVEVGEKYKKQSLEFLEQWLTGDMFKKYVLQIEHMVQSGYWEYLIDSFYQIIPFGTGGRRGEVGIGPNRINPWTIQASAQGHSQYLVKQHGEEAKQRGVVFTFDVRQFFTNKYYNDDLPNPVHNLNCKDLAISAAEVYAANGMKVYMYDEPRTTPQLSFSIRYLNAVAGDMFSASHNPPEHNGKKVFDEFGGQLIPPHDEALVDEITKNVKSIQTLEYTKAKKQGLIEILGDDIDKAYIQAASKVSLSNDRDVNIVYTPLHGPGISSVLKVMENLGFKMESDPKTSNQSGKFENVTFNIPNPEVVESFDTTLEFANKQNADIILNSDPDADRIGIMVRHDHAWVFLNGNEIAAILAEYVTTKRKASLKGMGVMIKTSVTTNFLRELSKKHGFQCIGELLVGFKYIADEMNKLEKEGNMVNFLFGCEESHGYLAGNYSRDKDACTPAIWLAEIAAEQKKQGKTLVDFLNSVYATYGYFKNYLTEIRMLGAVGNEKINAIQDSLRKDPPQAFGDFKVKKVEDFRDQKPIVSETDNISKNVLLFRFKPKPGTVSMKVTVRPSGTEPKIKMYFEIGSEPAGDRSITDVKKETDELMLEFEKAVMKRCYKIINVDFPDRGFLLFWQLPLNDKLTYFEIEPEIVKLIQEKNAEARRKKLDVMLGFLGADPIEKVDKAFREKYKKTILEYLDLR